jgi:hypothetical protein
MPPRKISRNAACPCESGKKYKQCCWDKGFDWMEDEDGSILKSVPMSDEMVGIVEEQRRRFIDQHGRAPGPDDHVFFDMPPFEHVEHAMVEAMKQAGIDPAIAYAFEKTGLLVTEANQSLISDADMAEWRAAIDEYHETHNEIELPDDLDEVDW